VAQNTHFLPSGEPCKSAAICSVHIEQDAACWLLRTVGIIRHAPPSPQGGQDVDVTDRVLDKLRALVTLRIDKFCGYVGAAMCVTVLASMAHRPGTAQLLHLSLHQLPLPPDNPQLVAAIQAHPGLVVSEAPSCSSRRDAVVQVAFAALVGASSLSTSAQRFCWQMDHAWQQLWCRS
jgi:hypothetical protein